MDGYSIFRASGPAQEPITVAEAKAHCNVTHADDDDLFSALVTAAREACEIETNRCFVWSTFELRLDAFSRGGYQEIRLPNPPLIRVNSIQYYDADNALQELGSDNFEVDDKSEPARIRPAPDQSWPATKSRMNAVIVSYVAGYPVDDAGSPADYAAGVPESVKQAMKLVIGHLYNNRDEVMAGAGLQAVQLPQGAKWLLWRHRVIDFRLSS
jgi:uncharacterized phiE125 gp8 family phage protein